MVSMMRVQREVGLSSPVQTVGELENSEFKVCWDPRRVPVTSSLIILLVTSASLLVTSALLVVTRS